MILIHVFPGWLPLNFQIFSNFVSTLPWTAKTVFDSKISSPNLSFGLWSEGSLKNENFVVLRGNAAFFKNLSQKRKQALVKIVGAIFALLVILGVWHHSSSNSKHHKKHHKKVTHTQEVNSKLKLIKYFPAILDMFSLRLYSHKSSTIGNFKS